MLVSPNNSFKPTPSSVPLSAAGSGAILHSTGRGRRGLTQSLGRTISLAEREPGLTEPTSGTSTW